MQTLNRVYRLKESYVQIKRTIEFAVTAEHCWCIVFNRDESYNEIITIFKINHIDIFYLEFIHKNLNSLSCWEFSNLSSTTYQFKSSFTWNSSKSLWSPVRNIIINIITQSLQNISSITIPIST